LGQLHTELMDGAIERRFAGRHYADENGWLRPQCGAVAIFAGILIIALLG
jgi:hypothetical protein